MSINEPDQTLEIIMTKLDPEVMKIFSKEVSSSAEDAAKVSFFHSVCLRFFAFYINLFANCRDPKLTLSSQMLYLMVIYLTRMATQ